jgi:hypothetical protein
MRRCKNMVSQYVPRGFGYKEVKTRCGSTSIHGDELLCDECQEKAENKYPQGWRETPGDTCEHGCFVGDAGGPDYMCPACEMGE